MTFGSVGTDVQIIYKKYYIHICVCKKVLLIFPYTSVRTKMEVKMKNKKKIKFSLLHCSEKRCDECFYNRWVRDVCQTHLCRDALALINGLEDDSNKIELEQLTMKI